MCTRQATARAKARKVALQRRLRRRLVGFAYAQRLTEILVHNVHQMVHKWCTMCTIWCTVHQETGTGWGTECAPVRIPSRFRYLERRDTHAGHASARTARSS